MNTWKLWVACVFTGLVYFSWDAATFDTTPQVTAKPPVFAPMVKYAEQPQIAEKARWCRHRTSCKALAEAVVYEARGEGAIGQYAVAWVILNRANEKASAIPKVISKKKQFSFVGAKKKQNKPKEKDWTNGYIVAYDVLNKRVESPVGDATHYHTTKVNPKWAKGLEVVARIDNHIFYR